MRRIKVKQKLSVRELVFLSLCIGLTLGYIIGNIQVRLKYAGFCKEQQTTGQINTGLGFWILCKSK